MIFTVKILVDKLSHAKRYIKKFKQAYQITNNLSS